MRKRGIKDKLAQSNIITTVLLVLISLAAVALVAVFVINMVRENVQEAEIISQESGLGLENVEYVGQGAEKELRVLIKKQADTPEELIGVKILVNLKNGSVINEDVFYSNLSLFETKEIYILIGEEEVEKVEMIPLYTFKGKTIIGKTSSGSSSQIKTNPNCNKVPKQVQISCSQYNETSCSEHEPSCSLEYEKIECNTLLNEGPCLEKSPQCTAEYIPGQEQSCGGFTETECIPEIVPDGCHPVLNTYECSLLATRVECESKGCDYIDASTCDAQVTQENCESYGCVWYEGNPCKSTGSDFPERCEGGTYQEGFSFCEGNYFPQIFSSCSGTYTGEFTSCFGSYTSTEEVWQC